MVPKRWYRILYPRQVVLVSCASGDRRTIVAVAWSTPLSADPPLVGVSLAPQRFSHELIKESGEFVINVPPEELLDAMWFCGTRSGREVDKFEALGLEPLPSKAVSAPRVPGCRAYLECKVRQEVPTGDHTLFVGEVVHWEVSEESFDQRTNTVVLEKLKPIFQISGDVFIIPSGKEIKPSRKF